MNYFAHGCDFVGDPYFLAGTAVPDWLNVVDRRVRVRARGAGALLDELSAGDEDPRLAEIARGVLQHCRDDAWFHESRAFAELSLELCRRLRDVLPADDGFRPHFLGHILVEILLDAALVADDPARLEAYYRALDDVDGQIVEAAVNRMAARRTERLGRFIPLFSRERFLWDYADDGKLLFRLNQVMGRVRLPRLPGETAAIFPAARALVGERKHELLAARTQPAGSGPANSPEMQP